MTEAAHNKPSAVSIVLPVYNERESVAETLRRVQRALADADVQHEIIVVDDGSDDGSVEAVEAGGVEVRLLRHENNRGYGAALKTGFAAARYNLLAFLDADGSYPAGELPRLIEAARDADMVVGERTGYDDRASWARRLGKAILVPLANYLAGRRIPDLNSGMRVVRRDLVERYWPLLPEGFSLTATLTMALLCAGRRVVWLPVDYAARVGRSKVRPVSDMTNFLILVLRTMTYFRPLRIYLPLSVILVLASVLVVLVSRFFLGKVMDVTSLFLFIAGLQTLLIGVIADLVLKVLGTRE
ncbi:MAG TPA: glycosyltransferase family 2 protein [Sumerlaeia bacterium]|nr:glycosyltransferase family 2 protein [Sumerlaeia bacterium]